MCKRFHCPGLLALSGVCLEPLFPFDEGRHSAPGRDAEAQQVSTAASESLLLSGLWNVWLLSHAGCLVRAAVMSAIFRRPALLCQHAAYLVRRQQLSGNASKYHQLVPPTSPTAGWHRALFPGPFRALHCMAQSQKMDLWSRYETGRRTEDAQEFCWPFGSLRLQLGWNSELVKPTDRVFHIADTTPERTVRIGDCVQLLLKECSRLSDRNGREWLFALCVGRLRVINRQNVAKYLHSNL